MYLSAGDVFLFHFLQTTTQRTHFIQLRNRKWVKLPISHSLILISTLHETRKGNDTATKYDEEKKQNMLNNRPKFDTELR